MLARENPFRTERIGGLAFRSRDESVAALFERLITVDSRGAILGPHGSGKTTLLRELGARFRGDGWQVHHRFLNEDTPLPRAGALAREVRALGPRDALLFDGAGHLPRLAWHRLVRAARGAGAFVVTCHAPVGLPTLVETGTDAALLEELTRELVGASTSALAPVLDELRRAREGNLREVFLDLYDLAAHDDPRLAELYEATP